MSDLLFASGLPASLLVLLVGAALSLVFAILSRGDAFFVRGLGLAFVGLAGYAAVQDLFDPALDAGTVGAGGAMVRDHLAAYLDLLAVGVGAVALVGSGRGVGATGAAGAASIGAARRLGFEPLVLTVCAGAGLVFHAGDLLTMLVGAELVAVAVVTGAMVEADETSARALIKPAVRQLGLGVGLFAIGVALIYAATSSLNIYGAPELGVVGLRGRIAAVFTQWGAVQEYAVALERAAASGTAGALPEGLRFQFASKVVTGMAPASLLIPGVLLLLAGTLTKTTFLPFGTLWRRLSWSANHGAGVSVSAGVLVPLVGLGIVFRLFVGVLHTSRLVREPYGWVGPLPMIALATALIAGIVAIRHRDAIRIASWLSTGVVSSVLLCAVAAASFAGQTGGRGGMVTSAFERDWARLAADQAMASGLYALTAWVVATAGLILGLRILAPETSDLVAVSKAARRDPWLGASLSVLTVSLVGFPPLVGGIANLSVLRALVEHSALRPLLLPLAVAWLFFAIAAWRLVQSTTPRLRPDEATAGEAIMPSALAPRGSASTNPGRAPGRIATLLLGATLVIGGLFSGPLAYASTLAAAGISMGLGGKSRTEWVEQRRAVFTPASPNTQRPEAETAAIEDVEVDVEAEARDADTGGLESSDPPVQNDAQAD